MLPGEPVVVLTAGTATDPDSGDPVEDWGTPSSVTVGDVLVERLSPVPIPNIRDAVMSSLNLYFQTPPTALSARNRVTVRGVTYDVQGEPGVWRLGDWHPGLAVTVVDILPARRAAAEALMVDTCQVDHPTGSTLDDDTGEVTPTYSTLYTGKCRVQINGTTTGASTRDVGDQQVSVLTIEVQLPVAGTEGVRVRDQVTILRATNDTDLLDRTFSVAQPAPESDAAARRIQCLEVTA